MIVKTIDDVKQWLDDIIENEGMNEAILHHCLGYCEAMLHAQIIDQNAFNDLYLQVYATYDRSIK